MKTKNIFLNEDDKPSFAQFAVRILPKLIFLLIATVITSPLWLVYWLGCLIWYRPPNVPYLKQTLRYLSQIWTVSPEKPALPVFGRIWLSLSILHFYVTAPIRGIAWLLDELFYGRALNEIPVIGPFFVISAGRSGSTQITRYIEEDQRLVAPTILQCMFPYLWLWRLAPNTIGRFIKPDKVRELIQSVMPKELWERHEADPFKSDTFDGAFLSFHLNRFSLYLGPEVAKEDFNMGYIAPYDVQIKEKDFVKLVDRLARKSLLFAGLSHDGETQHFYLKGHFLFGAQALSEQYPDASFLTVIREPLSRLRSGINYMRVNPPDPVLGPVPWSWLADTLSHTEMFYSKAEQDWFTKNSNSRRSVIRFTDFVNDLEASMRKVYSDCFETDEVPAHIPKDHLPRERKHYTVNRTLSDLGIDEVALQNELREYIDWCHSSSVSAD
jgi:hypothetical protein